MKTNAKPRILYLPLEFATWKDAQYWSYPMGFGLEEGFGELGLPWLTLPALFAAPTTSPHQWLAHLQKICAGQRFDQVWFTANHIDYDDATIDFLTASRPCVSAFSSRAS